MFWEAVVRGASMLAYWEVWAAVVFYMICIIAFMATTAKAMGGEEASGARTMSGCLMMMLGGPVIQGILTALLISYLAPIMFGSPDAMRLGTLFSSFGPIAIAGIIGIVAGIIISLLPIIGGLLTNMPGVMTFIQGAIIFRLMATPAVQEIERSRGMNIDVFPGFWHSVGFFLIAGVLTLVLFLVATLLLSRLAGKAEGITAVLAPAVGVLGGLLPVFMYGSYVGLNLWKLRG